MERDRTYSVTLMRPGPALPYIEVGAYRYVADWLPSPGDTITVSKASEPSDETAVEVRGFVTRVDPTAQTPISVTELKSSRVDPIDDYLA